MYHAHFRGTHYEAGFQWGSLLLRHKNNILTHIPFPITPERTAFALSCIPVYQTDYPEILEEIQGLADGQQCDVRLLQTVIFSMYSMPPSCSCSCFAASDGGKVLLGRNSDFLTELEKLNLNVIYRLTGGAFAFTGNTTSFIQMEDGVNEYGLAAGLTSVYPHEIKPGFNAGLLLRYFLEKCRTVSEAVAWARKLPIASAQTITLADSIGDIAVIECSAEEVHIAGAFKGGAMDIADAHKGKSMDMTGTLKKKAPHAADAFIAEPNDEKPALDAESRFVCATNAFHLPGMSGYNTSGIDDWSAEERYQTLTAALSRGNHIASPAFARELLSGKHGFLCQYDRKTGRDTVWSVIYDLSGRKIYRSEGNPGRCAYKEDRRFFLRQRTKDGTIC